MTDHKIRYENNFLEQTVSAFCSCGWWAESDQLGAVEKADDHIRRMMAKTSVVPLAPVKTGVDADAAQYLRDLADRIEKDEIKNLVVVFNDKENNCYERFGHFKDRWHILGAIEYAKSAIDNCD